MRARVLLAAMAFPAFTLSAQQPGGAAPSGATTAAAAGIAALHQAHARLASIDDNRSEITPTNRIGVRILERLRTAVFLGVFDNEAGTPEYVGLLAGPFSPYPLPAGFAWSVYAESGGKVYPAKRAIENPDAPPAWQPTVNPWSGCWWIWLFTDVSVCS